MDFDPPEHADSPTGPSAASLLESLSKVIVVLSALAAVGLEASLGAREWPLLFPATLGAIVGGAVMARLWAAGCWSGILFFVCLVPAAFLETRGSFLTAYQTIWWGAVLGAIVGTINLRRWTFPPRWRVALAFWALAVSLAWPIVVAREADFNLALLDNYHVSASGLGGPPPVIAVWILNVALTHLVGLLWFDWCFRTFSWHEPDRFRRRVVYPLALSALVGAMVASYQGLVDVNWLGAYAWPAALRAGGTLLDAPASGALLALWMSAFLALVSVGSLGLRALGIAGFLLSWVGMYATGSRTALFCAGVTLVINAWGAVRGRSATSRRWLVPAALAMVACLALVSVKAPWKTMNAFVRASPTLPRLSVDGLEQYVHDQLWNRDVPVGTVSVVMIREFPGVGVGVGSYNHLLTDYVYAVRSNRFGFDNAQNWYRHQLAELGLAGSLGWLWWVATFGWLLVTTQGGTHRFAAGAVRASLIGVALISLVAMPTQEPAVALTVWFLAFWYLTLSPDAQRRLSADRPIRRRAWWVIVWVVVLGYEAETFRTGWTSLRPPYRALMADWNYERGWYDPAPIEKAEAFRWTASHAVSVFGASAPYLRLSFRSGAPDTPEHPVNVKFVFWVRRSAPPGAPLTVKLGDRVRRVATATLSDTGPVTWYVKVPLDQRMVMIEVWVSRTWRPSDFGQRDTRDLGLAISDWVSVASPPGGAVVK